MEEIIKELEWIKSTTTEDITIARINIIINKIKQYKKQLNKK